jgi:hypothetical protein
MTQPQLMNCSHNPDGWCLDCVKELYDKKDSLKILERLSQHAGDLWDKVNGYDGPPISYDEAFLSLFHSTDNALDWVKRNN